MRRTTDSSRTHGTQHVSEDSMPSAGLCVCLLPLSIIYIYTFFLLCFLLFSFLALKGSLCDALSALLKPGGFFNRGLFIWVSHPTHALDFRMHLFFAIICIDMT